MDVDRRADLALPDGGDVLRGVAARVPAVSELVLGDGEVVWANPPDLGHFGIKLRKQQAEAEIIERMDRRRACRHEGTILEAQGAGLFRCRACGTVVEVSW